MNNITVVLTNWMRSENIPRIVSSLVQQTEKPIIFLWDNAAIIEFAEPKRTVIQLPVEVRGQIDWYVTSSLNKQCLPRWWMAERASTPYVMVMDDDLMLADSSTLQLLLEELDATKDRYQITGAFGKKLVPSLAYEQCPQTRAGQRCDIVLGRIMAMRTRSLRRVLSWSDIGDNDYGKVDDIVISSLFSKGKADAHYCSEVFKDKLFELPDAHAICREPEHFIRREKARRIWFDL